MKIVDKYILRQLVVGFTLILVSLTILIWLTQSLKMIDMIVTKGVSVGVFLEMTLLVLPNFLQILMPLALFAVTLFTFIRMQSDKELMVLKAVGMSGKQLMRPVLMMAGVLTLVGYGLSFFVIPWSTGQIREMKWKIQNNLSQVLLQEGQFNSFGKGKMVYIRERSVDGGVKGILAYEIKDGKKTALVADTANLFQTNEGLDIHFGRGVRQEFDTKTKNYSVLKFDKYTMSFSDQGRKAGTRTKDARELGIWYLLKIPKDQVSSLPTWRKYKVEAFKRLTMPLYNFVFALLALAAVLLGAYSRRGNSGRVNFVVGCALFVQTMELAFDNMSGKNLWFLILSVLNIIVPVMVVNSLFKKERGKKFFKKGLSVWLLLVFFSGSVQAMMHVDVKSVQKNQPVDFESDNLTFNQKTGEVVASGNVILNQNGSTIQTEKIVYDKNQNIVHVPEEAYLTLSDGTKAKTDQVHVFPNESELITGMAEVDFVDGTHVGTDKIIRRDKGEKTVFKNASYTPCDICEGNSPLWRLSAGTIEEDEPAKTLRFWNMFFRVKDVPVVWFPYFQMPDPSVKRKTGFLIPSFGSNSEMKGHVSLPFFVNLADNQNLTITPKISIEHNPLGLVNYQGLFRESKVDIEGSLTRDDKRNQGHIKAGFDYHPNSEWRFLGQYFRTTSDTYFRRFKIEGITETDSYLTSHLGGEYYGTRLQGSAEILGFQSFYEELNSKSIPVVLPIAHLDYVTEPLLENGLYAFSSVDTALINNRDHFKSNRLSLTQGLKLPFVNLGGMTLALEGNVRADGYSIDTGKYDIANKAKNDSYFTGRIFPQAVLTLGYPLIRSGELVTQIIEPIAQIIVGSNGGNSVNIPNQDSSVFDFSDANLFSDNRFSGHDRVESGSRVNYGVQWSAYGREKNNSFQALFGQTYVLRDENELTDVMGYKKHLSNYVGRIRLTHEWMSLTYRFRLNQNDWSGKKHDLSFEAGLNPLRLGINYLFQDAYHLGKQYFSEKKEVTFYGRSQLTKNFSAEARYRYNMVRENKGPLESEALLRYDNECTTFEVGVSKSFTSDRNYHGGTSVNFRLYLKTLGGK